MVVKEDIFKELKEVLHYDPDTGIITWKINRYKGFKNSALVGTKGEVAGCLTKNGYREIRYKNRRYYEHRIAFFFINNYLPDFIDHVDRDKSNNKINNLRECNKSQNEQNKEVRSNNTSGYRGVSYKKRNFKFASRINLNGKEIFLGYFEKAEDAAKTYDKKATELFGEFAYLNFKI